MLSLYGHGIVCIGYPLMHYCTVGSHPAVSNFYKYKILAFIQGVHVASRAGDAESSSIFDLIACF